MAFGRVVVKYRFYLHQKRNTVEGKKKISGNYLCQLRKKLLFKRYIIIYKLLKLWGDTSSASGKILFYLCEGTSKLQVSGLYESFIDVYSTSGREQVLKTDLLNKLMQTCIYVGK